MSLALAAAAAAITAAAAAAPAPVPITIGYRAGDLAALPLLVAERDWWQAAGLQPNLVSYAAAPPLLAAGAAKSWDVAAMGGLAAVLGAFRFGLQTVGIADDASDASVVMAKPAEVDAIFKNPAVLKGKSLWLTPDTAAEYAALACLAKWKLKPGDMTTAARQPAQIVADFAGSKAALAALSSPADFALFRNHGAITVCSAKNAGAPIPEALVVQADFALAHPDRVARFLAVVLRTLRWEKAHPGATVDALRRLYEMSGTTLDEAAAKKEIERRPTFALGEQLHLLDRSKGGEAIADRWLGRIAAYLVATAQIQAPPITGSFLTDRYLNWVAGDKMLKQFVDGSGGAAPIERPASGNRR